MRRGRKRRTNKGVGSDLGNWIPGRWFELGPGERCYLAPWAGGPVPDPMSSPPWETLLEEPDHDLVDIGPFVLRWLRSTMMIDEEWSVPEDRGLVWWPFNLAQRISVSPPRMAFGDPMVRLETTSDFVADVKADEALVLRCVDVLNTSTSLCAYVWDPERRRITVTTTAYLHADTLPSRDDADPDSLGGNMSTLPLVATAALLGTIEAHEKAAGVAELVDGAPDVSEHPASGARSDPDELLSLAEARIRPAGNGPSRFVPFIGEPAMHPWWCMMTVGPSSFTGELPFNGTEPATFLRARCPDLGQPATTLVQYFTRQPHPGYGSGLLMVSSLPPASDPEQVLRLAAELNRAEATEPTGFPLLGAWCSFLQNPRHVAFTTFVPSFLARPGLVGTINFYGFLRNEWARARLT